MNIKIASRKKVISVKRGVASRELEAWKKRNARHLKKWQAARDLRAWRVK